MTLVNRSTVCALPLCAGLARILAVSVGVICMMHMAGPLWGQPWDCTTSSTMCSTNSNVGIGTSTPTSVALVSALLSVVKNQNAPSSISVLNNTNNTAAGAAFSAMSASSGEI